MAELLRDIVQNKRFNQETVSWEDAVSKIENRVNEVLAQVYGTSDDTDIPEYFANGTSITVGALKTRIMGKFKTKFDKVPPFTVLRLAEILIDPKSIYSTPPKFLRGLEIVTSVSSSSVHFESKTDPLCSECATGGSLANGTSSNGKDQPQAVPVSIGDDTQAILLSRIDWLTPGDLKEIKSESYLVPSPVVVEDDDDADSEESRKRKTMDHEPEQKTSGDIESGTPEKKLRIDQTETESEPLEGSTTPHDAPSPHDDFATDPISEPEEGDQTTETTDHNMTLPEDRMNDDHDKETSISETSVNDDENYEANTTLPEDKMDVDQ